MTKVTLIAAIDEAKRFLKKADVLAVVNQCDSYTPSKELAAVKRSSMDLTRALAEMRKV